MNFVTQALELEDTIKNFEHRSGTGWFAISPFFLFNSFFIYCRSLDIFGKISRTIISLIYMKRQIVEYWNVIGVQIDQNER